MESNRGSSNVVSIGEVVGKGADGVWEDLLGGGNGGILKRVEKRGKEGGPTPEFLQNVTIHIVGRLANDDKCENAPFLDTRNGEPLTVTVGEKILNEVPPGVMLAIRMMELGEICIVRVDERFGYSKEDANILGIPPKSNLVFEVELVSLGRQTGEAADESLGRIVKLKNRGNAHFRLSQYNCALRCYAEALKPYSSDAPLESSAPLTEIIKCVNNSATTLEKLGRLKEAKEQCVTALQLEPDNLKALLRAARIATLQGIFEEADLAIKRAAEVHGDDSLSSKLISRSRRSLGIAKTKHNKAMKAAFRGAFASSKSNTVSKNMMPNVPKSGALSSYYLLAFAPIVIMLMIASFFKYASASAAKANALASHVPVYVQDEWNDMLIRGIASQEGTTFSRVKCEGKSRLPVCCACLRIIHLVDKSVYGNPKENALDNVFVSIDVDGGNKDVAFRYSNERVGRILNSVCEKFLKLSLPPKYRAGKIEKDYMAMCKSFVSYARKDLLGLYLRAGDVQHSTNFCFNKAKLCNPDMNWASRIDEMVISDGMEEPSWICDDRPRSPKCCACRQIGHAIYKVARNNRSSVKNLAQLACSELEVHVHKDVLLSNSRFESSVVASCRDFVAEKETAILRYLLLNTQMESQSSLSYVAHLCDEGIDDSASVCTKESGDWSKTDYFLLKPDSEILEQRRKKNEGGVLTLKMIAAALGTEKLNPVDVQRYVESTGASFSDEDMKMYVKSHSEL